MLYLIAIIVGALIGAVADEAFGALVGGLLGWLLVRSSRLQRELTALRASVEGLLRADAVPSRAATTTALVAAPAAAEPAPVGTGATPAPVAVGSGIDATPALEPGVPVGRRVPVPPRRDLLLPLRRWLFGGNTIVKAGVAILFVGLAFLAKFASEHIDVPAEFRLASIAAVAIVLLVIGWRLRLRRPGYAQVLQGGAIAALYLTLFAAFRFYGVLAAAPAFALMVSVVVLAAALAVLQDARSLAVIGALGGFATPLIVSTGSDNYVALFSYYLILDAGIAGVAWWKTWRSLNLIGFFATFLVATAWGVLRYRPESFLISEAFLIGFFLVFVVIMVLPARRAAPSSPHRSDAWVNSSLLFGLPTIVFALQYGLVRDSEYGTALSALALAAFYVVLATWMQRRPALGITFDASLAIATVFLTLVVPFALDARSTAGAWTLEGAALVWIGFRQRRWLLRGFGYALTLLAGASMLIGHERHGVPEAIFNAYLFNGLMAAGAAIAAAFFVQRRRGDAALLRGEAAAEPLLIALATIWLLATAALQIDAFVVHPFGLAAFLAAVSAIAAFYLLLATRLAWPGIAWPVLAHAPFMFLAALVLAATWLDPWRGGGWWAWPVAFAVHGAVLRLAAPRWPAPLSHAVHVAGALALALLGALIGRAASAGWGDPASAWPWLGWLIVPAALLLVLPRPATARVWPVSALPDAYRVSAAAVLAGALWLWTLIANVASNGSASPLPHLPLVNPLDLGVAVGLAAIVLWLRQAERLRGWPLGALLVAGFVWLNAMLVRAFHHYGGVDYRFDAWLGSFAVHTGIALLWASTALVSMWLGARRGARVPWVVGAGLLGAVVLKLILVDLAGTGSVTRIVSFIGVGLLMLVIGYVAPLPAKEVRHASA